NFQDMDIYIIPGAIGAFVEIEDISGINKDTNQSLSITPNNISLSLVLDIEKYYELSTSLPSISASLNNNGEIEFEWLPIMGAEEYELQWTWVDNYGDDGSPLDAVEILLNEKDFEFNNTNVLVKDTSYSVWSA